MNLKFAYKIAPEHHQPDKLLANAILAEKYGFESFWISDHFHPWGHTDGGGAFAWTWIASAAERTDTATIGTDVTAPILRYHPGIVAQAFATLGYMYPGRIFLGLGAGEALNESPLGYTWPSPRERVEMLEEAIIIIKRLWTEEFVSFKGKHYTLKKANLYTKPKNPPKIFVAAGGPKVAELAGRLADGIITLSNSVSDDSAKIRGIFRSFEAAAERENRDLESLEKLTEILVSYDEDYEAALKSCGFWKGSWLPVFFKYDISDPRVIEEHGELVGDEVIAKKSIVATTAEEHITKIKKIIDDGFDQICIVSSSPNETRFLKFYGDEVLPNLKG